MVKSVSDWTMEMIKKGNGLPPLKTDDISVSNAHITKSFDEKDLVSAKEARELSENSMSLECMSELREANEYIKKAINNGEYFCYCRHYLHNQAINKLRKLGYTVTNYSTQREGDCFKIEW